MKNRTVIKNLRLAIAITAIVPSLGTSSENMDFLKMQSAEPVYIFASKSGRSTLDQGDGGGNPFASSFVELLGHRQLTYEDLLAKLAALTKLKSHGYQEPDWQGEISPETQGKNFLPIGVGEKRVGLVLVFSDYSASSSLATLRGAKNDLERVSSAMEQAKFAVATLLDPSREELRSSLVTFERRSSGADVAFIYTTGHGAEVDGVVYLLPGDFETKKGKESFDENALRLSNLGATLKAQRVNILLYGGCRSNLLE